MKKAAGTRSCRACGCTDLDCGACIERTGKACHWVEPDLCSACAELGYNTLIKVKRGNDNIATARVGGRTYRASCTAGDREACVRLAEKVALAVRAESGRVERYKTLSLHRGRAALYLTFRTGGAA